MLAAEVEYTSFIDLLTQRRGLFPGLGNDGGAILDTTAIATGSICWVVREKSPPLYPSRDRVVEKSEYTG